MPLTSSQRRGMQRCTICSHEKRVEIEQAFARGLSRKRVAQQFGLASEWPGFRHWRTHVTAEQKAAMKVEHFRPGIRLETVLEEEGQGLLVRLSAMRGKLLWLFDQAIDAKDAKPAASIAAQLLKLEEIVGKATGDLTRHANKKVSINVVLTPEWQNLQRLILTVLQRYPEAYDAVLDAMRAAEETEQAKLMPPPTLEGEFTDATDPTNPVAG